MLQFDCGQQQTDPASCAVCLPTFLTPDRLVPGITVDLEGPVMSVRHYIPSSEVDLEDSVNVGM